MRTTTMVMLVGVVAAAPAPGGAESAGDLERGAELFRACAACHALAPGEHRTGPSLADVFNRKAGTVPGFTRYSEALEGADVIWDHAMLDAWLADPAGFIPGNRMIFQGIPDADARADLIAYLETATRQAAAEPGTGGMMGGSAPADLRTETGPSNRISAIHYCGDTYTVEVEAGEAHPFWEFNLRFKTDSSARGPEPGHPVLIPAGMTGDRAFVIFADPTEISAFIEIEC